MNSTNIEGTLILNGLLEGRLPDDAAAPDRLRQWVRDLSRLGIDFQLEITGSNFSLLPDNRPRPSAPLGDAPQDAIRQALEQLLEGWPPELAGRVTSTLRSTAFLPDEEVQTLYVVRPDGEVHVEQRTVAAQTEPPSRPLSVREVVRMVLIGIVIAAALMGIAALFVDVPALARQLIGTIRPVRADEIVIDNKAYDAFFHVAAKRVSSDALTIVVERTAQFPRDDAALQQLADDSRHSIKQWLAVAALARSSVQCELYDDAGKYIGSAAVRIGPLRDTPSLEIQIPRRSNKRFRLGKILFAL